MEIGHSGGIDVEVGDDVLWVSTKDGVLGVDPATNVVSMKSPWRDHSTWTSGVTHSG